MEPLYKGSSLKSSVNMSNEFRDKHLDDPIDINVNVREMKPITETPDIFVNKDRVVNKRDASGPFKIPSQILVKRTNPSDAYELSLKQALEEKKALLRKYEEQRQSELQQSEHIQNISKGLRKGKKEGEDTKEDFEEENYEDYDFEANVGTNTNLLKILEMQVNRLKKQGQEQLDILVQDKGKNYANGGNGIPEIKVDNDFIYAEDSRVQALKHVKSQQKPEYLSLEDLQKLKNQHQKKLIEIENDYYGMKGKRPPKTEYNFNKGGQIGSLYKARPGSSATLRKKYDKIKREGYMEELPLDNYDQDFLDKFEAYKEKKYEKMSQLPYEEEWNTTKIKSLNSNGVVNRRDGLSGVIDDDDYKMYYYNIYDANKMSFERPLVVNKHSGKQNTRAKTYRTDPEYVIKPTKFALYTNPKLDPKKDYPCRKRKTDYIYANRPPDMMTNPNVFYNTQRISKSPNPNEIPLSKTMPLKSIQGALEDTKPNGFQQNISGTQMGFLKMIYGMLSKNSKGEASVKKMPKEMNMTEDMITELGFNGNEDFNKKLNEFPTENKGYMNENEFINFFCSKGDPSLIKNGNEIEEENEEPYEEEFIQTRKSQKRNPYGDVYEEHLPGLKTDTFGFLKYPNTPKRLRCLRKSLEKSRSARSLQNSMMGKLNLSTGGSISNFNKGMPLASSMVNPMPVENNNLQQSQNMSGIIPNTSKSQKMTPGFNIKEEEKNNTLPDPKRSTKMEDIPEEIINYKTNQFHETKTEENKLNENNPVFVEDTNTQPNIQSKRNLRSKTPNMNRTGVSINRSYSSGMSKIYRTKADVDITIPKPFNFLKNDYNAKKLEKMEQILMERQKMEDEVFHKTFHANPLNKKMFNHNEDLGNIIQREKIARKERTDKLKEEIIAGMKPFSFYDKDEEKYKQKLRSVCEPPKFKPFKANPVGWKSQVNMYDGIINRDGKTREQRVHERALATFNAAKLPPRMEMHEKNKKLQQQELQLLQEKEAKTKKKEKFFEAKKVPDFKRLQEQFINRLENQKQSKPTTKPKPFTFHEPKKKPELWGYEDIENDPEAKNPKNRKDIKKIIEKMKRKPAFEPATTKGLSLLMDKRRNDLEAKKKEEERIKKEDEERIKRQNRLNERVNGSKSLISNDKALKKKRDENTQTFINKQKQLKEDAKRRKEEMLQRVANRPLLLETIGKKIDYIGMGQDLQPEIDQALNEGYAEDQNKTYTMNNTGMQGDSSAHQNFQYSASINQGQNHFGSSQVEYSMSQTITMKKEEAKDVQFGGYEGAAEAA
ncbi:MAG: hypothetical protein MJ252_10560 [archaeon]|nr:hypothetical protein [archaeon]